MPDRCRDCGAEATHGVQREPGSLGFLAAPGDTACWCASCATGRADAMNAADREHEAVRKGGA
jgi:hypothetical protein